MSYYRFIGVMVLIAGISGLILSISSDYIGLSLTGGNNGFGIVNIISTIFSCSMLVMGMLFTYRASLRPVIKLINVDKLSYTNETLYYASSIPTLSMNDTALTRTQPKKTVITKNVSDFQIPVLPEEKPGADNEIYRIPEGDCGYECPTCNTDVNEEDTICSICGEEFE